NSYIQKNETPMNFCSKLYYGFKCTLIFRRNEIQNRLLDGVYAVPFNVHNSCLQTNQNLTNKIISNNNNNNNNGMPIINHNNNNNIINSRCNHHLNLKNGFVEEF